MNPCGRFGCAPATRAQKQALQTQMERLCLEGFLEEWSKTDGSSHILSTHLSLALSHGLNRLTRLLVQSFSEYSGVHFMPSPGDSAEKTPACLELGLEWWPG